jgi:hypothetical protein
MAFHPDRQLVAVGLASGDVAMLEIMP